MSPRLNRPLLGALCVAFLLPVAARAELRLASPFGDHMVLQQQVPVPVWGEALPGEQISVSFAGQVVSATADDDGEWRVELAPLAASAEPRTFTVTASSQDPAISLDNVLVGEVWICGGQSNMERQLGLRAGQQPIDNWEAEAATAEFPQIRQLYVQQTRAESPQDEVGAEWTVCTPESVVEFTAVGFFFARSLHLAREVPVGIIHSSWGGTPAEAWTSREGLEDFPEFAGTIARLEAFERDPEGEGARHLQRLAAWYRENDPGSGEAGWQATGLDSSGWETMELPTTWESAGHGGFNGVAWFRKRFDLPAGWETSGLTLQLSAVDDFDTTWVNGVEVGRSSGWQNARSYPLPDGLLRETGNVIAVRVLDTAGDGGIWDPESPLEIAAPGGGRLPLAGEWRARFSHRLEADNQPPSLGSGNARQPTVLYNGMIHPLLPYAIRGATFYQGESNAHDPEQYEDLLPALIADWRGRWERGDFPFLFVQIAPHRSQPPEIREAQLNAWRATENTAMVVTLDVGDADDIHPTAKKPVGERLALAARAVAYGEDIVYSGPVYSEMKTGGGSVVLEFEHTGSGLVAKDGPLRGFTVAGGDGSFHPAEAVIEGDTVTVSSREVAEPVAVRYGWAHVADGNLFNTEGLPASPFRTDE